MEEKRRLPLIGQHKVQTPVAIHVRERNAFANHRLGKTQFRPDVIIPAIGSANEERIQVVPAQISARLEVRPEPRVMHDSVIAGAQGLQFRPSVDLAFNKPHGLNGLQYAVIIEIGQAAIPAPAAAGQPEFFAGLEVGGDPVFHLLDASRALPQKVTFGQAKFGGDVAHIDVRDAVPIDVPKIHAHPFERVEAQHARLGIGKPAAAFQDREFQMARCRAIVQQPVGPEVVAEVNLGQQISIEILGADGQRPPMFDRLIKNAVYFAKLRFRLCPLRSARPEKDVFLATVQRLGFAFVHYFHPARVRVQDVAAVLKIIADDQVHVAIAIKVRLHCAIGEPAFAAVGQFRGNILGGAQRHGRAWLWPAFAQEEHGRAAPIIDQQIHQPVLVEIARQHAHRRRPRGIVWQRSRA